MFTLLMHWPLLFLAWFTIAKCPIIEPTSLSRVTPVGWITGYLYVPEDKAFQWWYEEDRFAYIIWAAEMSNLVKPFETPMDISSAYIARNWVEIFRERWFGRYKY